MTIDTTYLDSGSDKIKLARPAILAMAQEINSIGASGGSALIGYLPTSAAATELQTHLRYLDSKTITVKDPRFGAVGDWNGTTGTDDTAAIQLAIDYASANKVKLRITGGNYRVVGVLKTRSNLHIEFDNDAWICPTAWNAYGGVLTNVADAPVQSNVFIDNPQFDGQWLPTDALGNSNAMGFANGASFFRVNGGYIKNFAFSWSVGGAGGKAINFESGVTDSMITNLSAENCGCAVFVQGKDGAANEASRIIVSNVIAKNCEAAVAVLGINAAADPDGDAADSMVIIDGVTFYNCGHAPNRPVGSNFQKSGAIVLGEAQNVHISNVKGYNSASYPASWPSSGTVVGSGLSGPIGAVVWGWGRNITLSNIEYHGDCDSLIKINIARAIGEDGSPDGIPENVFRFDVDGLRHYGTATYVLDKQANITNANLTGTLLNIFPDTVSTGFMSSNMNGMTGLYCQIRSAATPGKVISGTSDSIYDGFNTFAASGAGVLLAGQTMEADGYRRESFTISNTAATSFTPKSPQGILAISSPTSLLRALVSFRADATPQIVNMGNAVSNFAVTTGALTGVLGGSNFTVSSHTDGKIYLENNRGGAVTVNITFIG